MSQTLYPIVGKTLLNDENLLLEFHAPAIAEAAKPGQFVNVQGTAFLRRPFGIARVDKSKGSFQIGIKAKGCGTKDFFRYEIGDELDILGPLGTGFNLDGLDEVFVIGGGTGIYPLLFLADECRARKIKTYVATGFRTVEQALLIDAFVEATTDFLFALEKGTSDYPSQVVGYAQSALEQLYLKYGDSSNAQVLCCGPLVMMQKASEWAKENGFKAQVSMEERMACGIGICRTCAIELNQLGLNEKNLNYARCCVEGPVFPAEVIAWP